MKLGLGTVQFGCDYGISNTNGQVNSDEIYKILEYAKEQNINVLDTASMYGNSEEVLGRFDLSDFKIVTKTIRADKTKDTKYNVERLEYYFKNSLKKLNQSAIYGLLFHEANDLIDDLDGFLWQKAEDFKKNKYVNKIGVSVYTPQQLHLIMERYPIDIVQLPLNLLDQRFVPMLKTLKEKNIEIHTRSTFLQGLILMPLENVNEYFGEIKSVLNSIPSPKLAYALQFVKNLQEIDNIIVGTTCLKDLEEIVMNYKKSLNDINYKQFSITDEKYIMPQNWQLI